MTDTGSVSTDERNPGWTYLMDMDGVLVHEEHIIPGADAFLTELQEAGTPFIVLTNNSIRTPAICGRACCAADSTFPRSRSGRRPWRPRRS